MARSHSIHYQHHYHHHLQLNRWRNFNRDGNDATDDDVGDGDVVFNFILNLTEDGVSPSSLFFRLKYFIL